MSSTVVKRLGLIATATLAIGWSGIACAAKADGAAVVVARLYKDFAWQAVASQTELFGEDLSHQNKAKLEKYFAPAMVSLLFHDAACQARTHGICNLDFDLLFDSQDPRVTDLNVKTTSPGRVSAVYKDPVDDKATRIDFEVTRVDGIWKITDIVYQRPKTVSLKQVLSRKVP